MELLWLLLVGRGRVTLVMGPDAELPVRALHAEVLDPLLLGERAEAGDLDTNAPMV